MASVCVKKIGISPESFLDCPPAKYPSYGWLSPKISFSRELPDGNALKSAVESENHLPAENPVSSATDEDKESDPVVAAKDFFEFEFQLEDAVNMLPADELFSDGKLVPLMRPVTTSAIDQVRSNTPNIRLRNEISPNDPYLFSPRAPTCSSRWKELLGLKRFYQNNNKQHENQKATPSATTNKGHKSLKIFHHRSSKSSESPQSDSSLNLPLIQDTDCESISLSSSRLSLSSSCSSSGHEYDDIARHSLDSEKPNFYRNSNVSSHHSRQQSISKIRTSSSENPGSIRTGRSSLRKDPELIVHDVSVDSPRMNSSGKIVFQSLERSSSSPSSFNGGPRYKYRGMEQRSYSANVRYTPVLNVPVCSLRGSSSSSKSAGVGGVFGFPLFSPTTQQKKEGGGSTVSSNGGGAIKGLNLNRKNRTDRA